MQEEYTSKQIFDLQAKWDARMQESYERGDDSAKFVIEGEQNLGYDTSAATREQFVFNLSKKFLRIAHANACNIDLSMSLVANQTVPMEEKRTFSNIVNQIMFSGESIRQAKEAIKKVYNYGYAVFHVKAVRESQNTLNKVLQIESVENVKSCFFDLKSRHKSFNDGNFCGRCENVSDKALLKYYGDKLEGVPLKKVNKIADFWYRKTEKKTFVKLTTGVYKLKEDLDPLKDIPTKETIQERVKYIAHKKVLEGYEVVLEENKHMPVDVLPMTIDYGSIEWVDPEKGYQSFPFCHDFKDSQLLFNYAASTAADIMKQMTGDKWLFSNDHIQSEKALKSAKEINEREGGLIFDGDIATIRRERGQEIPASLVQMLQESRAILQEIAGSYMESGSSQIKAVSGVSLDKLFERVDLVQNNVIVGHLDTINIVGNIVKNYIPVYYHENRQILIDCMDGQERVEEINKPAVHPNGMAYVENDIKDIAKNYRFKINAAPSKKLQSQNIKIELEEMYKINPKYMDMTIDIYAQNLDVPNADVLSRRFSTTIPPELIDFGSGDITKEQYNQIAQEKQQKAQQQQMLMMQNAPDSVLKKAKAQEAISSAQTKAFSAETDRLAEHAKAMNSHIDSVAKAANVNFKNKNEEAYIELEKAKSLISHIQSTITGGMKRD